MAESTSNRADPSGIPGFAGLTDGEPADPRQAFRNALAGYTSALLETVAARRGLETEASRAGGLASELTAQLDAPAVVRQQLEDLDHGARMALSFFALSETTVASLAGIAHALACLGVDPQPAILALLARGLAALDPGTEALTVEELAGRFALGPAHALLVRVHPAVPRAVRVPRLAGPPRGAVRKVSQIREPDGLEPILRLGALWQRVGVEPLRQTQQGTLYKRDQERLDEDPVLSHPVSDAPAALPGLPSLWLTLATRLGLLRRDPSGDRLVAAPPEFWNDNAVHLPQMIATSWLGLRDWRELSAGPGDPPDHGLPAAYLRPAALLWLACLAEDEWLAVEDLAAHLKALNPRWDVMSFQQAADGSMSPGRRGRGRSAGAQVGSKDPLVPLLLGAGYALGLVRAAEEKVGARPVVQLTPLGRYVLAMGAPPPPRPGFEQFLFVQPNLEIIAYRQGLTPQLIGRLSRFCWWTKLGAASELRLTQESILFGLDGGLTAPQMLELLDRHSSRPLPNLVPDAIRRWTERREQLSVYTAATLLEFGTSAERDQALAAWIEEDLGAFIPVAERFLLVESPAKLPTDRIRTSGARDYRHPPEKCVRVEADGITLALDPQRSDLLIDAELSQLAEELPVNRTGDRGGAAAMPPRRYVVTTTSLKRAGLLGITTSRIVEWFQKRTGAAPPPAVRLLLHSVTGPGLRLTARRMLILSTPTEELADGLLQHPETLALLGERLGPTAISVPDENAEPLRGVLERFGLGIVLKGTNQTA